MALAEFQETVRLNPNDGYAHIWRYLARSRATDARQAREELASDARILPSGTWPGPISDWLLGETGSEKVLQEAESNHADSALPCRTRRRSRPPIPRNTRSKSVREQPQSILKLRENSSACHGCEPIRRTLCLRATSGRCHDTSKSLVTIRVLCATLGFAEAAWAGQPLALSRGHLPCRAQFP